MPLSSARSPITRCKILVIDVIDSRGALETSRDFASREYSQRPENAHTFFFSENFFSTFDSGKRGIAKYREDCSALGITAAGGMVKY